MLRQRYTNFGASTEMMITHYVHVPCVKGHWFRFYSQPADRPSKMYSLLDDAEPESQSTFKNFW